MTQTMMGPKLFSSSVTDSCVPITPRDPSLLKKDVMHPSDGSGIQKDWLSDTLAPRDPPPTTTGQAQEDPDLPRGIEVVTQPTATPQAIPQSFLEPQVETVPKSEPHDSPAVSWASSSSVVSSSTLVPFLLIYWQVNTTLSTIELQVQVALSLLDSDAHAWATPIYAQIAAVTVEVQGAVTPFANVELAKLCADKLTRERCTTAEFSMLFKGPVDHFGYGDLELCDKYLSGVPSCIYHKIELKMFAMWEAAEKHAMEVEQQLDIS
ncbi:hypothetical protein IEO21_10250 [Rhodonia placenta]|uniref:Uncharacterized protein n=1 Tax=Rhodonia placenta TaxID=104341 RepID=A0A8H7NSV5_9APHY|nr:hypothetical protein IEO21_10250 [Postia placenta]